MSETPYSRAWHKFINSPDGQVCVQRAQFGYATARGDDHHFAENRVRASFDAGWNAAREHYEQKE